MLLWCCIAVSQVPNISVTCVLASQVKEEGVMKDAKPEWARHFAHPPDHKSQ